MNKTVELLEQLRNKGGSWQTHNHYKADKLLSELKPLLTDKEYNELSISISHYRIGEGAGEFYGVCKKLKSKYE